MNGMDYFMTPPPLILILYLSFDIVITWHQFPRVIIQPYIGLNNRVRFLLFVLGKWPIRFGSYKTFNHDLVHWLVALSLEKRPIKTLHPANTVFWLDNLGVRVQKLELEMFMTTRTPLNTGVNSVKISNSCFTEDTPRVTVKRHELHMMLKFCWPTVYLNKYK